MAHSPTEPTEPVMGVEPPSQPVAEDALDALEEGDRVLKPGSARSALRHTTFRRVFIGAFLSNIGTWMQNVVLGALAYDLTESPTFVGVLLFAQLRSEEHTSELQSLMRISYAVFCLKKKIQ